jgi:hypothetical protein
MTEEDSISNQDRIRAQLRQLILMRETGRGQHQSAEIHQAENVWPSEL